MQLIPPYSAQPKLPRSLGGSTLIEAYLNAQNSLDLSKKQDGPGKGNNANANANGVNQTFISSDGQGSTHFTLLNCGVSMPSGVSVINCL